MVPLSDQKTRAMNAAMPIVISAECRPGLCTHEVFATRQTLATIAVAVACAVALCDHGRVRSRSLVAHDCQQRQGSLRLLTPRKAPTKRMRTMPCFWPANALVDSSGEPAAAARSARVLPPRPQVDERVGRASPVRGLRARLKVREGIGVGVRGSRDPDLASGRRVGELGAVRQVPADTVVGVVCAAASFEASERRRKGSGCTYRPSSRRPCSGSGFVRCAGSAPCRGRTRCTWADCPRETRCTAARATCRWAGCRPS